MKKYCTKCGHPKDNRFGDWCGIMLFNAEDIGNHIAANKEDDYPVECCDGECTYERENKNPRMTSPGEHYASV